MGTSPKGTEMIKWFKDFFSKEDFYFKLDETKEYTDEELFYILKNETLRVGTGNVIVLYLLERMSKKLNMISIQYTREYEFNLIKRDKPKDKLDV